MSVGSTVPSLMLSCAIATSHRIVGVAGALFNGTVSAVVASEAHGSVWACVRDVGGAANEWRVMRLERTALTPSRTQT